MENQTNGATLGQFGPVAAGERISSIDVLRGFALLGLLSLNLDFAYWNPLYEPGAVRLNVAAWFFNDALYGTMRGLFSMLFGAGVVLLTSRAEASGRGGEIGDIYYRRLLWLLLFGLIHNYIIIWGDILFAYAIAGLFLFPLRRLSPKVLIVVGILLLLVFVPKSIIEMTRQRNLMAKAADADAREAAGKPLTVEQRQAQQRWDEKNSLATEPDAKKLQKYRDKWCSGYWTAFRHYARITSEKQPAVIYRLMIWDNGSMMLLGMGLMKLGVFSASRSVRFYVLLVVIGYGIGLTFRGYRAYFDLTHNFDMTYHFESGAYLAFNRATRQLSRLPITLGHVGMLVLIYKSGRALWLTRSLSSVGRMALTNYIMQSLIANLIFTYGLGLYGRMQRYQTLYVVVGVWVLQLVVSPIWLKYFRFGPLEWLWRSLTYWKPQPMRVPAAQPAQTASQPEP